MPFITVIIPFCNAEEYIEKCIQGLLAQDFSQDGYEIIMINNNSTDASAAIVQRYPEITLLEEKKQGAYAARNCGILHAKGDILAFTDSDCVVEVHWLQYIAKAMENSNTVIVLGSRQPIINSLALGLLMSYENVKKAYVFNSDVKELYFGHTNNMAVRRSVFDLVGLFSERARGADTIFVQHTVAQSSSDHVRYCDDMSVIHMEIKSLKSYYVKMFLHGRSAGRHKNIAKIQFLTMQGVCQILQHTIRQYHYPLGKLVFLVVLLIGSRMSWQAGKWSAVIAFEEYSNGSWSGKKNGSAYLLP